VEGLFDTPNNLWEHQLREIFSQREVKQDPLFQILTAVFQNTANISDVGDIYRLLGLENFTRLLHLLDGRTIKFPTSTDLKDAIILTLCYYYRKVERLDWARIHEILPFDFPSIAVSRKISNLDEIIQEKLNPFMTEDTMEGTQDQARDVLSALEDRRFRNDALRAANTDSLGEMKENLIQFFRDRIGTIKKSDELRDTLYRKLHGMLERDELTFEQMLSVYKLLGNENNTAADGVLSLFRPVPGTPSLFLEVSKPADKDEELKTAFKNYSAEELQAIERTMGHLASLAKQNAAPKGAQTVEAEVVK
jgi:hypothetical protein